LLNEPSEEVAEEVAAEDVAGAAALEETEDAEAGVLAAVLWLAAAEVVEAVLLFAAHDARANTRHSVNKIAIVFFIFPPQV